MALSNYIASLKKTRTYESGLIDFEEYSIETKLWGLQRKLPSVPRADHDRHVIVMEVIGDQPNLYSVLTDPKHSLDLTSRDADRLLFIFVEMRPRGLVIEAPKSGYQFGDGHVIQADLELRYQVLDAEAFWKGSQDPIANLQGTVINASKNFFLSRYSNELIAAPRDLKEQLEEHIGEPGIIVVKNDLEKNIKAVHEIPGVQVTGVTANIMLSDSLREHLDRLHKLLFEKGGVLDRQKIDQLIKKDQTYAPYSLGHVVRWIDVRLLENFYTKPWPEAMRLVAETIATQKEEYKRTEYEREMKRYKELLSSAEELELDEMHREQIKDKAAEKILEIAARESRTQPVSDIQFIEAIAGPPVIAGQLTSDQTSQSRGAKDET